jgi:hypothetical protein
LLEVFYDFWGQGIIDPKVRVKVQWMYEEWREDMVSAIQEGIEKGIFDAGLDHLAPSMLISLLEGAALQYLLDRDAIDLDAYFDVANEAILNTLGYRRERDTYPTDLSDDQWTEIQPLLPAAKPGGRPPRIHLRQVVMGSFTCLIATVLGECCLKTFRAGRLSMATIAAGHRMGRWRKSAGH